MAPTAQSIDVDPRIERSRELVLAATLDLLAEVGYGELTIEAVAARSGVAKSTIYRHWSGRLDLVTDAFTSLKRYDEELPPLGPVQDRVAVMLTELAVAVRDPNWQLRCIPALIDASAHCPEVASVSCQLADKGVDRFVRVLDDAVDAGELPKQSDTRLLADALTGPILLRALFHRPTFDPADVPALVAQLLPPRN